MEREDYVCMIPRNLEKPDTVPFGKFEITWKQVGYLIGGSTGSYLSFTSHLPIVGKIALSALSFGAAACLTFIKIGGVSLEELAFDGLNYLERKRYYNNFEREGESNVRIKFKEKDPEPSRIRKEPTVLPTKKQESVKGVSTQPRIQINIRAGGNN